MINRLIAGVAFAALFFVNTAVAKPEIWRDCKLYKDINYGARPDGKEKRSGQFLDLIMSKDGVKEDTPVYVHIHGGSWCQKYNKDDENLYLLTSIAQSGWLVVNANYNLADENEVRAGKLSVTYDDMLADIDAVLEFLRDKALPKLGIKAKSVALGGCSAGAHLALVASTRPTHPLKIGMVYAQVPPADLLNPKFEMARPFFSLLSKGNIKKYSPVELIRRGTPPAVIASMGGDELVPVDNFHKLTNAYHKAGVEISASLTPNCNHGDMPRELEGDVVRRINQMAAKVGLRGEICTGDIVLWPDKNSQILPLTDKRWPGWQLNFKGKERDFSSVGALAFAVTNKTAAPLSITAHVKGIIQQGQTPSGIAVIPPKSAGELKVVFRNLPWRLDAPLELEGMNGRPSAEGGSTFDVRRVKSIHLFIGNSMDRNSFEILGATAGGSPAKIKILKADSFLPFVDEYGQFKHDDWPGKVHNLEELRAPDPQNVAKFDAKDRDEFGGWKDGPKLKATGFFRTEKVDGKWWLVTPNGHLFFSHGVDCVSVGQSTGISKRESYFSWLPERDDPVFGKFYGRVSHPAAHGFYKKEENVPFDTFDFARANMVRKYGENWREKAYEDIHRRLHDWGINTIANWSNPDIYLQRKTPYTVCMNTWGRKIEGSTGWWGKLIDPFSSEFENNIRKSAQNEAKRTGDDPWCVGWFVDNELSWGNTDTDIAISALISPAGQPAKVACIEELKAKYGTIEKLNKVWQGSYASWQDMLEKCDKPGEKAKEDLRHLHYMIVAKYFRTIRDAIKDAAPNRLYLGTRIAWGAPVIYSTCAEFADVVSVNIYNRTVQRDLPPGSVDKPMIIGEFHFGALDRGMFHTGLVATDDQTDRARSYIDYVKSALEHPRMVGTHYFQYMDQALTARADGENYNIGFVSIADKPYGELIEAVKHISKIMYLKRGMSLVTPGQRH